MTAASLQAANSSVKPWSHCTLGASSSVKPWSHCTLCMYCYALSCVLNVYILYIVMLAVVCYIYPCLYNCLVLDACTLVYVHSLSVSLSLSLSLSLCLALSLSLCLSLSVSVSEATMVDEHCTAQWLHTCVMCACFYIVYIYSLVLYPH